MARDQFVDTVLYNKSVTISGSPQDISLPADNVRIHVFAPGTTTLQTIYTARTGSTQKSNPFLTGTDGAVEFWAEWGDYDVKFEETITPARIGDKTIGWNSVSGADSSISNAKIIDVSGSKLTNTTVALSKLGPDVLPAGLGPLPWAGTKASVPTGWLYCDGSAVSRTGATAALYAAIGTAYGVGNGTTTFNLPDLRGRVSLPDDDGIGRLTANGARGNASGTEKHALTSGEGPVHDHEIRTGTGSGGGFAPIANNSASGTSPLWSTEDSGSGTPHNNMQPYQVVGAAIIKT